MTFSGCIMLEAVRKVVGGDGWDLAERRLRKCFYSTI